MLVFGKLENIWFLDEEIIFEFSPLTTLGFDGNLIAYKVAEPLPDDVTKFCHFKRLLDYNVYSLEKLTNGLYIPLKYDPRDIIREHIVGDNPLHF